MKYLYSQAASEIDGRKNGRKASTKEKENISVTKKKMNVTKRSLSLEALTEFKHQCLNNIKAIKERLGVKTITVSGRKNSTEFEKNKAAFYKSI